MFKEVSALIFYHFIEIQSRKEDSGAKEKESLKRKFNIESIQTEKHQQKNPIEKQPKNFSSKTVVLTFRRRKVFIWLSKTRATCCTARRKMNVNKIDAQSVSQVSSRIFFFTLFVHIKMISYFYVCFIFLFLAPS